MSKQPTRNSYELDGRESTCCFQASTHTALIVRHKIVTQPWFTQYHGLRTHGEEITFTARPKIKSQSQIYRYGRSIFCLPHRPKISGFLDLSLHWVSVVCAQDYLETSHFLFMRLLNAILPTGPRCDADARVGTRVFCSKGLYVCMIVCTIVWPQLWSWREQSCYYTLSVLRISVHFQGLLFLSLIFNNK